MPVIKIGNVDNHVHSLKSLTEKLTEEEMDMPIMGVDMNSGKTFFIPEVEIEEIDGQKTVTVWLNNSDD